MTLLISLHNMTPMLFNYVKLKLAHYTTWRRLRGEEV
jgi:hypothetical protein